MEEFGNALWKNGIKVGPSKTEKLVSDSKGQGSLGKMYGLN